MLTFLFIKGVGVPYKLVGNDTHFLLRREDNFALAIYVRYSISAEAFPPQIVQCIQASTIFATLHFLVTRPGLPEFETFQFEICESLREEDASGWMRHGLLFDGLMDLP